MSAATEFDDYPHFFQVHLDLFDGPIDLLLHLVKQHELPIERLSLAQVTEQYLACLEEMRKFDLEIAGEYLVIAATLLSMKASILLQDPIDLEEDDEGNLVDPHEELLRRLREASVYKEGATALGNIGQLGIDVFAPQSQLSSFEAPPVTYKDHDPLLLGLAFKKLLEEAGRAAELAYTVTIDSVSIVDRMVKVMDALKGKKEGLRFRDLVPDITSKAEIIGSFLSLLELCKRQAIHVFQKEESDEIFIALVGEAADTYRANNEKYESEFDEPALAGNENPN